MVLVDEGHTSHSGRTPLPPLPPDTGAISPSTSGSTDFFTAKLHVIPVASKPPSVDALGHLEHPELEAMAGSLQEHGAGLTHFRDHSPSAQGCLGVSSSLRGLTAQELHFTCVAQTNPSIGVNFKGNFWQRQMLGCVV